MKCKTLFKVGDIIDFNGANKLKNIYFAKAYDEYKQSGGKYSIYPSLIRKYKKGIKLKIMELP